VAGLAVLAVMIAAVVTGGYLLLRTDGGEVEDFPELEYYATDLSGAVSEDDLYYIGEICYEVDLNTSCEMAVLVVNSTYPHDVDYYSLRTFQQNGIGKAGGDNGVLVVVATDDGTWRIEVGYGLEGILTDVRVNHLAQEYLTPNMTAGAYGNGLFELTYALGEVLILEYDSDRSSGPAFPVGGVPLTWEQWAIIAVVFIVVVIVTKGAALRPLLWLLALLAGGRGGGFGGGRSGGGGSSGGR
jgi:uncharacterized protein